LIPFEKDLPEPEEGSVKAAVVTAIRDVYDPDLSVNVYDLGLIYHVVVGETDVKITMTLTSPFCPVAEELPIWVKDAAQSGAPEHAVDVKLTFEPPFSPEMMNEDIRFAILGY
jgi:metal-sulfur cluster biosynthetic enzyme